MPFAAAMSTAGDGERAVQEVVAQIKPQCPGRVDLALLFFTPHHLAVAAEMASLTQNALQPCCLLGCGGEAIIANSHELDNGPGVVLWTGQWTAEVGLHPFHLTFEQTSEDLSLLGWPDELDDVAPNEAIMLTLADPFTFPVDDFLQHMNERHRGLRVMGGMASAGSQPGENVLVCQGNVQIEGAVGVLVSGPIKMRSIVSQGCRPIGNALVVTKAHDNIVQELGGKPPLGYLQELWPGMSPHDQELMQQGLHLGRAMSEFRDNFQQGDFLIRNVIGLDRATGALAVNDSVRVGQTVQFHVRDAMTASEDLHILLRRDAACFPGKASAGLLFSCNGRGRRLFEQPHHDARAVQQDIGQVPLAGFFAQGELGPIGGENFIHGYTASLILFED